jgi:hypothetical protein
MNSVKFIPTNSSMKTQKALCIAALLWLLSLQTFATTYYSRVNGGNWNSNATWSTVGYGNSTNAGTYPKTGDAAYIGDGYRIYINTSVTCASITIGQGISGILEYASGANYIVTVSGNVVLNRNARFHYNTAVAATHTCRVGGNFTNSGVVDFYYGAGQYVNVIFNGNSNSIVNGSGSWDLNDVSLIKTLTDNSVTVNVSAFENAIRNFVTVGSCGTYVHNNIGTYSINPSANFTIYPNVKFKVPMGTMWFASAQSTVTLQGSLYVTGGSVNIGSTAGTAGLQSDRNGTFVPYLEVTSGTLNVFGGISHSGGSALEPMAFRMTGGTININTGSIGTNTHLFCVNNHINSTFNMSGGTIILQKPNTTPGYNVYDVGICDNTVTTGGTIQFGNSATLTASNFSFLPLPNATYPHFNITGPAGNFVSVSPSVNAIANFKLLSLNIGVNKIFDICSISGTAGMTKYMTLLSNVPSTTDAFLNNGIFYARYSTVIFNGSTAQGIGGNTPTTFCYLSINNANNVTANQPINLTAYLFLVNGKLITTNTNILTCGNNANCDLGSASSYVEGPMVHTVASSLELSKTYPFGKSGVHRPVVFTVRHATSASVTYRAEIFNSPAGALPFTLPPTISQVSNVRYVKFIRQAVVNFSYGGIQMYYGSDDAVLDYQTLAVAQDDGTSEWRSLGGTATSNGSGYITSGTFNSFTNYFALANPPGGQNPLPVTLTGFSAKQNSKSVNVNWTTSAEINSDYYTVERSSNNRDYEAIAAVKGAGNSTSALNYSAIDENPSKGVSYYRLRQTDYDGREEVYPPVSVNYSVKSEFNIYPTVSNGKAIHLTNSENDMQTYSIAIQSMNGKTIPASIKANGSGIDLSIDEKYSNDNGVYLITATRGNEILRDKVIISKNN